MDGKCGISGGAKKRPSRKKAPAKASKKAKPTSGKKHSRASRRSAPVHASRSRSSRPMSRPLSRYSHSRSSAARVLPDRASKELPLTVLQQMAKARGIPWGGLPKTKLIHKINTY